MNRTEQMVYLKFPVGNYAHEDTQHTLLFTNMADCRQCSLRRMCYCFMYCYCVSVQDVAMLRYIRDRTAAPYFSNLVWFIGSHILDLDICVRNDAE